jgi:MFS family permease
MRERDVIKKDKAQSRMMGIHYAWIVAGVTVLAILTGSGVRSSFGVFIKPMEREMGWDRAQVSVAASLSLFLQGAIGPLIGRLVDRFGPRMMLCCGIVLLAIGTYASSRVTQIWELYLASGILMPLGAGGAALVTASAVAARWFEKRRGLFLGISAAGLSAGQLIFLPATMALTVMYGWRQSYMLMSILLMTVILPSIAWLMRDNPEEKGLRPYGAGETSIGEKSKGSIKSERTPTRLAVRTRAFRLLAASFFVCGYTTSGVVGTHLIPHALEHGFAEMAAAGALAIMGGMNVVGTLLSGYICDRYGARVPLALYYFFRGLSLIFLIWVHDIPTLQLFAVVFGLNYISTVPPTSTLAADFFGKLSVGVIVGWVFLSHQVGAAIGSYIGGIAHALTGNYDLAFLSGGILAIVASGLVLAIEKDPERVRVRLASATPTK